MKVNLDLYELKNICMTMAELGAANYAKRVGLNNDSMSQRQAYREFSQPRVEEWCRRGMVHPRRSGSAANSRLLYSREELLACDASETINSYLVR